VAKVIKVTCPHSPHTQRGHIGQYTQVKADCHQWYNISHQDGLQSLTVTDHVPQLCANWQQ